MSDTSASSLWDQFSNSPSGTPEGSVGIPTPATGFTIPSTQPGFSPSDSTADIQVPADLLTFTTGAATTSMSIVDFVRSVMSNNDAMQQWTSLLTGLGYNIYGTGGKIDPTKVLNSLRDFGRATAGAGGNMITYMSQRQSQSGGASSSVIQTPGQGPLYGGQRVYKGGVTEIQLTTPDQVQAEGNAVAQSILGRNLNQGEINLITQIINKTEYAAGGVHAKTAEAQQEALVSAYSQFGGAAAGGGTSSTPTTPSGGLFGGLFQQDTPHILQTIRTMESGNYSQPPNAGGASGAYQYIQSTWTNMANAAGYGQYANEPAYKAPPNVQDAVAKYDVETFLSQGHTVNQIPLHWYYPAAIDNPALLNQVPDPEAGNRQTPAQYQAAWMNVLQGGGGSTGGSTGANTNPGGTGSDTSVSDVSQLQPGQVGTVGGASQLDLPEGQAQVLAPVVGVSNSPLTPQTEVTDFLENQEKSQFLAHNLLDVFSGLAQHFAGGISEQQRPVAV